MDLLGPKLELADLPDFISSEARLAQNPLYQVTCGDISTTAERVEKYLESILFLGRTWDYGKLARSYNTTFPSKQRSQLCCWTK